jgi:hypothetical protein
MITGLWDIKPCSLVDNISVSGKPAPLSRYSLRCSHYVGSSETLLPIYHTGRRQICEDHDLHNVCVGDNDNGTKERRGKIKLKLSLCLIKHHAKKTYEGVEV